MGYIPDFCLLFVSICLVMVLLSKHKRVQRVTWTFKTFLRMACLVPALVAGTGVAHAQSTVPLLVGQSISTDGLTFTVSGTCTYGVFSAGTLTQPGCSALPSGDSLKVVVSGNGASFELVNTNGGAVISAVS